MQIIEELKNVLSQLEAKSLNESIESNRVIIVFADRKESLIVEIKDDTEKTISMKRQDYQYILIINQLFRQILPYLKLFGSKASHLHVKKSILLAEAAVRTFNIPITILLYAICQRLWWTTRE